MHIYLLLLLLVSSTSILPAALSDSDDGLAETSLPFLRKPYTEAQLKLRHEIRHTRWGTGKSLDLMYEGIAAGLHPDDIHERFLTTYVINDCPFDDPHESTLKTVNFLLEHNANPNDITKPVKMAPTYAIAKCLLDHGADAKQEGILERILECVDPLMRSSRRDTAAIITLYYQAGAPASVSSLLTSYLASNKKCLGEYDPSYLIITTLAQIGALGDAEEFNKECEHLKRDADALTFSKIVEIQKVVASVQEKAKDPRTAIQEILAKTDADLQRQREERAKARASAGCIIL